MKKPDRLIQLSLPLLLTVATPACHSNTQGATVRDEKPIRVINSLPLELGLDPSVDEQIGAYILGMLEDSRGHLWIGTLARGVARFDGETLRYFTKKDGLQDNTIRGVAEDGQGNMWFGTSKGLSRFDGEIFTKFSTQNGLGSNWIDAVFTDRSGRVWVGTPQGAWVYDPAKNRSGDVQFRSFEIPLPHGTDQSGRRSRVSLIYEDHDGNLWFGGAPYGVAKYDGKTFKHLTQEDGLSKNGIVSILQDREGNMWFGSRESETPAGVDPLSHPGFEHGGLYRYDGSTVTTFPEVEALSRHEVWGICEDRYGTLWFAAKNRGILRYDGETFTQVEESLGLTSHDCAVSILEDREGKLWFGFSGGLFRLDGSTFTNVKQVGPWK